MGWEKAPPELVERFRATLTAFPDAPVRTMFGYPCAFVGGHMTTGLFGDGWFVRTDDATRDDLLAVDGAAPLSPMPGRPMRGYVLLPPSVLADPEALHGWVTRAIAASRALPPKA